MGELSNSQKIILEDGVYETNYTSNYIKRKPFEKVNPKIIKAFIPGSIAEIFLKAGTQVFKGDTILILEAMKMRNKLKASVDGKIKSINVKTGEKVSKNQILVEIE